MRLRIDRWWLGCLLIAFGVLLYTAHAVALPYHDSSAPHIHTVSVTAMSPELTCTDRGLPVAEHECCTDDSDHHLARQTSLNTTAAAPNAPVGHAPVATGQPAEPLRTAHRDVNRALLQVWRH
jgi:hypothetical protein